jgi:hypothetical protein
MRSAYLFFGLLITLNFAKHCKPCFKESDCCGHCPIDPKTRVTQLVEVVNDLRGRVYDEAIKSLLTEDFIAYLRVRQGRCRVDIFSFPVSLEGFDYYVLHDDEWVKLLHDGSVQATFSIIALSHLFLPGPAVTNAAQIVQTWIPSEGICNYQLKQENYTDYRCFPLNN